MVIVKAKKEMNGVDKYASVKSKTTKGISYIVVKKNDEYLCSCPDFMFRDRECKHIKEFKRVEKKNRRK